MQVLSLARAALLLVALAAPFASADEADDRIARIAAEPQVAAALRALEQGEAQDIADMIELTEIPAPPSEEAARAARFAEMLAAIGLSDVEIDEVGNVLARRPGNADGPVVALIAHIDTVFPAETDVTVRIEGDTYRAPGIGDNSRGLVALLAIARAMNVGDLQTQGDVLFVGSVGEEGLGDLRGVRHLFRDGGPRIDAAIAIDGGEADRLVIEGVGSIRYRVEITGPGGHSWGAFGLANPHHALGRIITRFDEAAAAITTGGPRASYNVGRIGGGTSINSIPFESWMEVDMRALDAGKLAQLDSALRAAAAAGLAEENVARTSGPELTMELAPVGARPSGAITRDAPLAAFAAAAMRRAGIEPSFAASSTDANVPLSLGVPAITLSRGGVSGAAHALDEWWRNEDAHVAMQITLLTLLAAGADNP